MAKNKRDDIMEAALILFAERGYDGTTVPMIAEKAKVGAGTIYRCLLYTSPSPRDQA